jgi:hypothetical protein
MIAMTTSSSINVNPLRPFRLTRSSIAPAPMCRICAALGARRAEPAQGKGTWRSANVPVCRNEPSSGDVGGEIHQEIVRLLERDKGAASGGHCPIANRGLATNCPKTAIVPPS